MRRYLLPLLLFSAIGAVVVIATRLGRERETPDRDDADETAEREPAAATTTKEGFRLRERGTRTSPEEHRWLSEMERALGREDLKDLGYFRNKVAEEMDQLMANEKLRDRLLELIREHAVESDDLEKREWLLPMLTVMKDAEATQIIEEEYFRARTKEERLILLEAMARPHHNPQKAGPLAVHEALHGETEDDRFRAFDIIKEYSGDQQVLLETAKAIYSATTRPKQAVRVIEAVLEIAFQNPAATEWLRQRLARPRYYEIDLIANRAMEWGDERDAAQLERLAETYPAKGEMLREIAKQVRMAAKETRKAMDIERREKSE